MKPNNLLTGACEEREVEKRNKERNVKEKKERKRTAELFHQQREEGVKEKRKKSKRGNRYEAFRLNNVCFQSQPEKGFYNSP